MSPGDGIDGPGSTLLLRLGLGIFLALNVMVFNWLSYSQEIFGDLATIPEEHSALASLFAYLALFLTTVVVALLGVPMLQSAAEGLLNGVPDSRLLIVIGVFSAWGLSAVNTVRGVGSLYFDTAAMVLVVVTLGSHLEARAKQRATHSARRLLVELPAGARVRRGGEVVEVEIAEVMVGEELEVLPGEPIPVDGTVLEGLSHVDDSSLTGESRPRPVEPGERLLAGSLNGDGQLWMRVEAVRAGTVLAQMEQALLEARRLKPPIQRLADRVATVFALGVVILAIALFAYHTYRGELGHGLLIALSILLISCPCALGLAAPLACWQALRRSAEHGILIDSPATLERAATIDKIFFDKTGTLTEPQPILETAESATGVDLKTALAWSAGLEAASSHPIARALVEAARNRGIEPAAVEAVVMVPGLGVEGLVEGRRLRLGGRRWVERLGLKPKGSTDTGLCLYLLDNHQVLAHFVLREQLRPGAANMVAELQGLGLELGVLSGDRLAPVKRLASHLHIPAWGDLFPVDKVAHLQQARESGARVAMVGDGMNDGPVLAAADLGLAMGSASELACRSGNVRLLSDRLDRIPLLFAIARSTRRSILSNLFFAFAFNGSGILLAATGRLTPVFAALAMVLSSLVVVHISMGAGHIEPRHVEDPIPNRASNVLVARFGG
jgi:heavy metal translocating P-type ATPase